MLCCLLRLTCEVFSEVAQNGYQRLHKWSKIAHLGAQIVCERSTSRVTHTNQMQRCNYEDLSHLASHYRSRSKWLPIQLSFGGLCGQHIMVRALILFLSFSMFQAIRQISNSAHMLACVLNYSKARHNTTKRFSFVYKPTLICSHIKKASIVYNWVAHQRLPAVLQHQSRSHHTEQESRCLFVGQK